MKPNAVEQILMAKAFTKERGKGGLQDLMRQFFVNRGIPFFDSQSHKPNTNRPATPDFLCCLRQNNWPHHGIFAGLEAKVDAKPTKAQLKRIREIKAAGGFGEIIYSLKQLRAIIDNV